MEIKIISYKPEHFLTLRNTCDYFQQLHSLYSFGSPADVARIYMRGPAYTLLKDDVIIGCAGVMKLWKGVGDAWMLATPLVQTHPKLVSKTVKKKLNEIIQDMRFERVQGIVRKDFEAGHRWIKWLGFHEEGPLDRYFGGLDFIRYALITDFKE